MPFLSKVLREFSVDDSRWFPDVYQFRNGDMALISMETFPLLLSDDHAEARVIVDEDRVMVSYYVSGSQPDNYREGRFCLNAQLGRSILVVIAEHIATTPELTLEVLEELGFTAF